MSLFIICVLFPASFAWWLMPRVFHWFDRSVARKRIDPDISSLQRVVQQAIASVPTSAPTSASPTDGLVGLSSLCDAIARALKSGRSAPEAFAESIDRMPSQSHSWSTVRHELLAGAPVAQSLQQNLASIGSNHDERLCTELLLAAMVGPMPVVAGVEHAAAVLRDVASTRADLDVATSQARLSARILTALPLIVFAGGFLTNSGFRASVFTVSVFVPLLIGVVLNRVGWMWISRLLDTVTRAAERFELAEVVDRVCVSLMAGCTLAQACELLDTCETGTTTVIGESISARVREGRPLSECLEPLAVMFGLQGRLFADVLISADRDGLPVVATVARIAQDVRIERRRRVDTAIRQIPVKLTIPLVACVLPGFLLTTLVPLVASSVGELTVRLPGVISPFGS